MGLIGRIWIQTDAKLSKEGRGVKSCPCGIILPSDVQGSESCMIDLSHVFDGKRVFYSKSWTINVDKSEERTQVDTQLC